VTVFLKWSLKSGKIQDPKNRRRCFGSDSKASCRNRIDPYNGETMNSIKKSMDIKRILVPLAFILLFSFWGCVIYFMIGQNGPDTWFIRSQRSPTVNLLQR
jgi:hypothetical protein